MSNELDRLGAGLVYTAPRVRTAMDLFTSVARRCGDQCGGTDAQMPRVTKEN